MNKKLQLLIDQASTTTTEYFDGRGNITSTCFDKEKFAALVRADEREKVAKQWEQWHGFDKHTVAAIREREETE